ncbi:MAG TPA: hypothetical protein VG222_09930 [Vicinamibacterales bacterium]|nr:hypothetical protein [Vicinamibacterales bacterium]
MENRLLGDVAGFGWRGVPEDRGFARSQCTGHVDGPPAATPQRATLAYLPAIALRDQTEEDVIPVRHKDAPRCQTLG